MPKFAWLLGAPVLTIAAAPPAAAQPRGASIPSIFHGRWAPTLRGCATTGTNTRVVTVNARGWSSWEEGARVVRRGQVRNTTHHFATRTFSGADEHPGSLALRRSGARLVLSESVLGRTTHKTLVRCR